MELIVWPAIVLILGLVCIFAFKKSLERLIDRTQKVGKGGLEAAAAIQAAEGQQPASKAEEVLKEFDNELVVKREEEIQQWLQGFRLKTTEDRERVLIRHLAVLSWVKVFEKVYSLIWGSQLGVLQFLNSVGPGGADTGVVRPWFDQAAAREPNLYAGDTPERWLGFLENQGLIQKAGPNVAITLEGREFLKYIIHQGYPLYKAG
jgi:hypothetical protein